MFLFVMMRRLIWTVFSEGFSQTLSGEGSSFTMELLTALRGISVSSLENVKSLPPRNNTKKTSGRLSRFDQDENVQNDSGKPPVPRKSSLCSISNILQLSPRIFAKRSSSSRLTPHRENVSMRTRSPSPEINRFNNIELDFGRNWKSLETFILFRRGNFFSVGFYYYFLFYSFRYEKKCEWWPSSPERKENPFNVHKFMTMKIVRLSTHIMVCLAWDPS